MTLLRLSRRGGLTGPGGPGWAWRSAGRRGTRAPRAGAAGKGPREAPADVVGRGIPARLREQSPRVKWGREPAPAHGAVAVPPEGLNLVAAGPRSNVQCLGEGASCLGCSPPKAADRRLADHPPGAVEAAEEMALDKCALAKEVDAAEARPHV